MTKSAGHHFVLILCVLCAASGVTATSIVWATRQSAQAAVLIVDPRLDLGELWEASNFSTHLALKNPTSEPILVEDIIADCACTLLGKRSCEIPPRQMVRIPLQLDVRAPREIESGTSHQFSTSVRIRVRGKEESYYASVNIAAHVLPHPVRSITPNLSLRSPILYGSKPDVFVGRIRTAQCVHNLLVDIDPPEKFAATIEPISAGSDSWRLTLAAIGTLEEGVHSVALRIIPEVDSVSGIRPPQVVLSSEVLVLRSVLIEEDVLILGSVPLNRATNSIVHIRSDRHTPVTFVAAESESDALKASGKPLGSDAVQLELTPTRAANERVTVKLTFLCDGTPVVRSIPVIFRSTNDPL